MLVLLSYLNSFAMIWLNDTALRAFFKNKEFMLSF